MSGPRTLDIHTHVLTEETIDLIRKEAPKVAPRMTAIDTDSFILEIAGTPYRPFPRGGFDIERRFADMDAAEVDVQVLSATPQTYLYNQEPALGAVLSAIQNDLQTREAEGHEENPEAVNPNLAAFPGSFDFTRELWRIGNEPVRQNQRHNPDGNVDKEDPPPTPVVCNPTTERRADHRGSHDGHAVESESRRSLLRRKRVHENGLLHRSQPSAPDTLQNAKEDEQAQ